MSAANGFIATHKAPCRAASIVTVVTELAEILEYTVCHGQRIRLPRFHLSALVSCGLRLPATRQATTSEETR